MEVENVDGGRVEGVLRLCHHEEDDKTGQRCPQLASKKKALPPLE